MPCDLETTKLAACESGIGKLDNPISLLQIIAQLSCEIADAGGGGGGGAPGGAASSVQFNDAGAFGGFGSFNSGTSVLTIPGDLIFNTDNADDIGASGASRPRTGYFGTSVVTPLATILAAANAEAINVSGYSLTGANAQSMLNLSGVFNTTGNPVGIRLSVTDTASGASAMLMNLLGGAAGATSMFSVSKDGRGVLANRLTTPVLVSPGILTLAATTTISLESGGSARWTLANGQFNAAAGDVGFVRQAAGIFEINNGTLGTFRDIELRNIITNNAAAAFSTNTTLNDGAGAGAGTLANAPTAGDPSKWIPIDDNGTTRFIPSWV